MNSRIKWTKNVQFMGKTDNGHAIIMEVFVSKTSTGPTPLEMLLMGMGACASSQIFKKSPNFAFKTKVFELLK